jgi:hypothetical protein
MSTLSREFISRTKGRIARLLETPERGSITLEQVIWYSVIGVAAVGVVAALVVIINTFVSQVPTG